MTRSCHARDTPQVKTNDGIVSGAVRSDLRDLRLKLERIQNHVGATDAEKVARYRRDILTEFPPRFHKWFHMQFSEPAAWFEARTLFTRSAAAWSMVGHIIGLGDRHAENLLLDVTCGKLRQRGAH